MATNTLAYLGQTVKYPLTLQAGKPVLATAGQAIKSRLTKLLTTPIGSRELLPTYGSDVNKVKWEPNDLVAQTLLRTYITDAVGKWEKTVILLNVDMHTREDMTLCRLAYRILASNEVDSFIFPFSRKLPY